ncbi:MAG: S1C family serine protease [Lachnospiraceae bacterium]|nr:S1C family serine protease [Lachnospiraceae bacterium]
MAEDNKDFMIEKIKDRPINRKKLLKRTIVTASLAVLFGLIACFTFMLLQPVLSKWLYPDNQKKVVLFPQDDEEKSPEEMLSDNIQIEKEIAEKIVQEQVQEKKDETILSNEQIADILSQVSISKNDYGNMYKSLSDYYNEVEKSVVTINGYSNKVDWFDNITQKQYSTSGLVIANNTKQLLILADDNPIKDSEELVVDFGNKAMCSLTMVEKDGNTGLAVYAVNLGDVEESVLKNVKIANLGNSNFNCYVSAPVMAVGSPLGENKSVEYGIICAIGKTSVGADTSYKLIQTDMVGSRNCHGFLFDLSGYVVGILTQNTDPDLKNIVCAYGISDLKKKIEKLANNKKSAYLGIIGMDVSKTAQFEGVPMGAFVTDLKMDSPAMLAGIQKGDIIIEIDKTQINSFNEYMNVLNDHDPGNEISVVIKRQFQDAYKEMTFKITLQEAE